MTVPPMLLEWRHILGGGRQSRQAGLGNIEEWCYSFSAENGRHSANEECRLLTACLEGGLPVSFLFIGLDAQSIDFSHLASRGLATRLVVTPDANLPCRVTLNDAKP
ncbi:hypothetical protein [Salinicola acroporae]|uniref:hypothetical protein n=1 Tax=Salinicola acroporae TaxID=1541440 RepID=UPI0013A62B9F|nr:hypothetical protein [Salinicola acroporae]